MSSPRSLRVGLILAAVVLAVHVLGAAAGKYSSDWSTLANRPIPKWFPDAKLGIFIHWGLYSVPAWTPVGRYAEWYEHWMERDARVRKYHRDNYGANFKYTDFANLFTASKFDPEDWAHLFKDAGAKYVVLTTRHHDGYALWPSKPSKGYNSVATGPKRDLVGDVTSAVKRRGLTMGLYYSQLDWSNPLYKPSTIDRFVATTTLPELYDIVNRYNPDMIFSDGDWGYTRDQWRSNEFLSYVYNKNPRMVVNDRFGSGGKNQRYSGYMTNEYNKKRDLVNKRSVWEEQRGIGWSFSYNKAEKISDYLSPEQLVHHFARVVATGGNLLLGIGPKGDGSIPAIQRERLLQLGAWLKTNGAAIYNTRACSFSAGSTWEVSLLYTCDPNSKFFAIKLNWENGPTLTLKGAPVQDRAQIRLLGTRLDAWLRWTRNSKGEAVVTLPNINPDESRWRDAYAFVVRQ